MLPKDHVSHDSMNRCSKNSCIPRFPPHNGWFRGSVFGQRQSWQAQEMMEDDGKDDGGRDFHYGMRTVLSIEVSSYLYVLFTDPISFHSPYCPYVSCTSELYARFYAVLFHRHGFVKGGALSYSRWMIQCSESFFGRHVNAQRPHDSRIDFAFLQWLLWTQDNMPFIKRLPVVHEQTPSWKVNHLLSISYYHCIHEMRVRLSSFQYNYSRREQMYFNVEADRFPQSHEMIMESLQIIIHHTVFWRTHTHIE